MSQPIAGTLVETYLCNRGIKAVHDAGALRFHPHCYYRPDDSSPTEPLPAMIAAVTDSTAQSPASFAPGSTDRDATKLRSIRRGGRWAACSATPFVSNRRIVRTIATAATSWSPARRRDCAVAALRRANSADGGGALAAHLAALILRPTVRRLYVVRDNDAAGYRATTGLIERAKAAGVEAIALSPTLKDFNDDLRAFGLSALRAALSRQIAPEDVVRFLNSPREAVRGA